MLMQTLFAGVLRVLTPLGPRYVNPSFLQRIYLLWLFRNFHTLPVRVLSPRQQRWVEMMCAEHGFVSVPGVRGFEEMPVLGTLEQRPTDVVTAPMARPSQSVAEAVAPFAADVQQR